ncbi:MAG: hypothetical protein E7C44_16000 [Paeniclostridium sordellii]|nr:hypothetical protein [Paeniclostridium sordellii]
MIKLILILVGILFIVCVISKIIENIGSIIGIGIICIIGYFVLTNLGSILKLIISNLHIIIGSVIILFAIGIAYNKYEETIGKNKKLKLRANILDTVNKIGMGESKQIANILAEDINKVDEELKILVQLGEIDAQQMTNGVKAGEYVYKSLKLSQNTVHTNYQCEEINLD